MSKTKTSKFFKATTAAAVAASAVAVAVPAVTEASTFKDIKPGYQFYDAITELANRGVISGFPEDGTFKPDNHLTRGQAAKIIAGALGLDTKNVVNPGFKDIPTSHQYYGPIAALAQAGIITGYEDNTYRQAEKIQRNHVAKIIAGAFSLTAKNVDDLPFTDVRADYKADIAALFENGVTTGKTATTFQGAANVTRGQIAAFIIRAEQAPKGSDEVVVQGNTITFTVGNYENNTIVIGENSYTYTDSVRPIFTQANKAALAGASMTVTVADGVIQSVKNITLNKSGFASKPSVFAANNATIETLTINGNYVSVKDLKVTGHATVTNKATDKVEFTNVAVTGNIIVDNKGAIASTNNQFAQDEKGVEVVINNTTAANIIIRALATLTGKSNLPLVTVEGPIEVTISIEGTIVTLTITDANARVTLGTTTFVTTLNIPKDTKVEDIIVNYAAVAKQIAKVIVGAAPSTGGGSGGSGGGSSVAFKSTVNATIANDEATLGFVGTTVDSSNVKVATAAIKNGKIEITSKGKGTATITVTDANGNVATIEVTVSARGVITINKIVKSTGTDPGTNPGTTPITFTFDDSSVTTADITTIDVTAVNIAGSGLTTADVSTINTNTLTITFGKTVTLTSGDTITIQVTRNNNQQEDYVITFDGTDWIATLLGRQ